MTPKAIGIALLGLGIVALGFIYLSADDDIAKAFIAKGDESLKGGDANRALEFYQKALKESPNLPDVHFKLGEAYLKLNEKLKSRRSFRKCIELINGIEKPAPAMPALKKKSEQYLTTLEVSRKDGMALEQEYIKQLIHAAKKLKLKDNLLAEESLARVLEFDPENAEALKLLDEVRKSSLFPRWKSIFMGSTMDGWEPKNPSAWRVENDRIMVCDGKEPMVNIRQKVQLENNFKVSLEFKISESYYNLAGTTAVGILLGHLSDTDDSVAISVIDDRSMEALHFLPGKPPEVLGTNPLPKGYRKGEWNRLQIDVADKLLHAYINGESALEIKVTDKDIFKGMIGLWVQRCKVGFVNIKYLQE